LSPLGLAGVMAPSAAAAVIAVIAAAAPSSLSGGRSNLHRI
jgi:hypothetical protein